MHRLFDLRELREFRVGSVVVEEFIHHKVVVILLEWAYLWLIVVLRIVVADSWKNDRVREVPFEFFAHLFDGILQLAVHPRLCRFVVLFTWFH